MLFTSTLVAAFTTFGLFVGSQAHPTATLENRQLNPGPGCEGLQGLGSFNTAFNFTLAALNKTLPNANLTGAPLVLGSAGAVTGESFRVLSVSVYAAYR